MKRLFVSIPLSKEFREIFSHYETLYPLKGVRWAVKENLHLTVHFIGEVENHWLPEIQERIRGIANETSVFTLHFSKVMFAPPGKTKRMVWGVFSNSDIFQPLVDRLSEALNFNAEIVRRSAIPHITLARIREKHAKKIDLQQPSMKYPDWVIRTLELQESVLTSEGATYRVLCAFPLGDFL